MSTSRIFSFTHFKLFHAPVIRIHRPFPDLTTRPICSLTSRLGQFDSVSVQNKVLKDYVKRSEFGRALEVFDEMPVRDVVTYNVVICGLLEFGFEYFRRMMAEAIPIRPDEITFNGLFRSCFVLNDVGAGKQLHCFAGRAGFGSNCFVGSSLVDMYAKLGMLEDARRAFDEVVCRDLIMWNVMVSCYASNGLADEACRLYSMMRLDGVAGDAYTFSSLLSCGFVGTCDLAKQLHCAAVKLSCVLDLMVASALVDTYAKNGNLVDARRVFDGMRCRNIVSWNTMIVGYGRQGDGLEALKLFYGMLRDGFVADEVTLASVISSCGLSALAKEMSQVHGFAVKDGFDSFPSVKNSMVNAYSKCGNMADAGRCFSLVAKPDLITWTSTINAFWTNGLPKQAVDVFENMLSNGVTPDPIAFLAILSACSHGGLVPEGVHYFNLMTYRYHITPNQDHYSCLIDLLSRCGLLTEAFDILSSMPVDPGPDTLAAFLGACKTQGQIDLANWAAEKLHKLEPNEPANLTAMSNTYASIGDWTNAEKIKKTMRKTSNHKTPGCSLIV